VSSPDLLEVLEGQARGRERAAGGDGAVERRAGGVEERPWGGDGRGAAVRDHGTHALRRTDDEPREPGELPDPGDDGVSEQVALPGGRLALPGHHGERWRRIRGEIHDVGEQRVGRDPVGERVVHLGDHRDPAIGHAFADVDLPERSGAVQLGAREPADELLELAHPTGRGYDLAAHVEGLVEVAVLDPDRVVDPQRHLHHAPAERWQQVQPGGELLLEALERVAAGNRRDVHQRDLQGVHVERGGLHVQETRVHAWKSLDHPASGPLSGRECFAFVVLAARSIR